LRKGTPASRSESPATRRLRQANRSAPIAEAAADSADRSSSNARRPRDQTGRRRMMLKGLRVQYLIRQGPIGRQKPGHRSAPIGLRRVASRLTLAQMASISAPTVIAPSAGDETKAKVAQGPGLRPHHRLHPRGLWESGVYRDHRRQDRLPVVLIPFGKDTFLKSLDCMAPARGSPALFGPVLRGGGGAA